MVSVYSVMNGINSTTQINRNEKNQTSALNALSSGKKINKASDNPASLAIATGMMADVSALRQSSTNLVQGTSVLQTADGALEQAGNMLNRMKELSTQANSGALDSNSRAAINEEYQNLRGELNNLTSSTTFNGQQLLNGTFNQNFQAGTTATNVVTGDLSSINASTTGLGLTAAAGDSANALLTQAGAQATSDELDTAISNLSSYRANVGAQMSTFSTRGDVVDTETENTIAAQSSIMDADIGEESTRLSNSKALNDLSIAAAAQGNRMTSSILKLVRQ